MAKKYKTIGNLEKVWEHIDNALSEINLAYEDLMDMTLAEDDGLKGLKTELQQFDESRLVSIKSHIEELIEEKNPTFFVSK